MEKLTTVRLDMSDLARSLDDVQFRGLLEKGYTLLSCHVVREDTKKHDELLLIMCPPVDDPQLARLEAKLDELVAKTPESQAHRVQGLLLALLATPWLLVAAYAFGLFAPAG